MTDTEAPTIYTIGHSIHPTDKFIGLLQTHRIQTVVDVRSTPYSGHNPQFNQPVLKDSLFRASLEYTHLATLGGYPEDKKYYDDAHHAVYERIAATREFKKGIEQLDAMLDDTRPAIMCAQGKPEDCHRHHLLARCLLERGLTVTHILRDGTLLDAAELFEADISDQLPLFELPGEDRDWRSPQRVR